MYWLHVDDNESRLALINQLMIDTKRKFWSNDVMRSASQSALGDPDAWRSYFSDYQQAIWHMADLADREMERVLETTPPHTISEIIKLRLDQNVVHKGAVRHLFLTDVLHPILAVRRTNRTSKKILNSAGYKPEAFGIPLITAKYTFVVMAWLVESKAGSPFSRRLSDFLFGHQKCYGIRSSQ